MQRGFDGVTHRERATFILPISFFLAAFQLFALFNSNVSIFTSIFSNPILKRNASKFRRDYQDLLQFTEILPISRNLIPKRNFVDLIKTMNFKCINFRLTCQFRIPPMKIKTFIFDIQSHLRLHFQFRIPLALVF